MIKKAYTILMGEMEASWTFVSSIGLYITKFSKYMKNATHFAWYLIKIIRKLIVNPNISIPLTFLSFLYLMNQIEFRICINLK